MPSTQNIPGVFRAHFARHNRQVLALTAITLVTAILLWGVAYIVIYWVALFAMTVAQGLEAHLPASFLPAFIAYAIGLCLIGWMAQKLWPDYFLRDKKSAFEIFMDFVLAAPRVTLAVWGNLSAWQSLDDDELLEAWELLRVIGEHDGRLSVSHLSYEIPDPELRTKVVFALQITGLVELRKNAGDAWLALKDEKARLLSQGAFKIEYERKR